MSKLRQSARGQECTVKIAGICNYDNATTVLAHLPCVDKGMGFKSPDWWAAFACSSCHSVLDQHKIPIDLRAEYMLQALYETWRTWVKMGLIKV